MAGRPRKPIERGVSRNEPARKATKRAPAKAREPFVFTIRILDKPNNDGDDVLFSTSGHCPKDIDPEDFEAYIAEYFGSEVAEDEDEDYIQTEE